jgi:glycine hydroxymethyltransferase
MSKEITGAEASDALEKNGIIVNKNTIPYDIRKPMDPSGIRMGTPALTTRGMKEEEMKEVARLIKEVLINKKDVLEEVRGLCKKFPLSY